MTDLFGHLIRSEPADFADVWVTDFNRTYQHAYKVTPAVRTAIAGIIKRGGTLEQLVLVTRYLRWKWQPGWERMQVHFTPKGITRPSKWPDRLQEALEWKRVSESPTQPVKKRLPALEPPPPDAVPREELADLGAQLLRRIR